ncbi:hypothetical protein EDC96DRAFT_493191 [Choanephora cucurbitarum]|nr:hypothetical protein EDC96DRAFT_493191 [Choanephora cucurbitarum]
MEYDGYLLNLLRDPQAIETGPSIRPLDADTLRDAFSLKEGPIPGFDATVLGTDDTSVTPHPSGYAVERDQYGNAITGKSIDMSVLFYCLIIIRCGL